MKDKTIYQMCICNLRYAQGRDNHLAPATAVENIKEAMNDIQDIDIKTQTIKQIIEEIEQDLAYYTRKYDAVWREFQTQLKHTLSFLQNIEYYKNNGGK